MTGLSSIELIAGRPNSEVAAALQKGLKEASCLRAAVAYWCVGPKQLGADLIPCLSGNGYLCVDIHLPTDIDILAQMSSGGANVYLYLKDPNPQPGEKKSNFPPHLLHPKLLLFDYADEPADLWVGSHNWTARALKGINIEASLRVRLDRESPVYSDALNFLESVRTHCVAFDVSAVDYYKWLQGEVLEEPLWVLEISGSRMVIEAQNRLTVFGKSTEDYRNLKSVDKNLVVSIIDPATNQESLYEATVSNTGYTSDSGVNFDSRPYALQDGTPRPPIMGPAIPPSSIRAAAKSWATIEIVDNLSGATFEMPPAKRWVTDEESVTARLSVSDSKKWFPKPDKPLVQRAVSRQAFESGLPDTPLLDPLREAGNYVLPRGTIRVLESSARLLRKKIVRAKRSDGTTFTVGKQGVTKEKDEE